MNMVPVPAYLMGTLMNAALQGQAPQQAGPAAPMQAYQSQMQLPAGFPGPVFNLPGQPAQPGMAGGQQQQQWQVVTQQQATGQLPQVAAPQQVWMDNLVAAVAAAMQERASSGPPVGSHPRDEQTLVDALKKGRTDGLNARQSLEKLHKVNGHTEMDWKNYFLDHLERLQPIIYGRRIEAPPHTASRREPPSSSTHDHAPRSLPKPSSSASARGKARVVSHRSASSDSSRSPSPQSARSSKAGPSRKLPASTSGSAHSKASKVVSEHAGVQVPLLPPHVKPEPPRKPAVPESGRMGKFTNEEKIFFIQFLRWRLERVKDGAIPDQLKLCYALHREAPHRSVDSWKTHWNTFPQLPGSILAEAESRLADRAPTRGKAGKSALSASDEEGEEDNTDEEAEDEAGDASGDANIKDAAPSHPPKRKRRMQSIPQRITEEDFREMARYKLERLHEWDEFPSQKAQWEDFTSQNKKRSHAAWMLIVTYRGDELDAVVEELRKEQEVEKPESPEPEPAHAAPPLTDAASSSTSRRTSSANAEKAPSVLQKRDTDSRLAIRSGSPVSKRIKQEPVECISLLSDSD
ncbi:hypothetical protein L227DRAFT_19111 [Lentinus tigrinus ALCF2SS1-6]|uniref:Uncharacterized protein n=1 Tax=Lentinus tigrinus ALCF2SS1-6 TaxID=1328759 RepID=A0A5C2SUE9_9APHY|nr:hypothetical protein L227DRAFT_19111 [Lentinus tigrinus ALCF2SS1-6]